MLHPSGTFGVKEHSDEGSRFLVSSTPAVVGDLMSRIEIPRYARDDGLYSEHIPVIPMGEAKRNLDPQYQDCRGLIGILALRIQNPHSNLFASGGGISSALFLDTEQFARQLRL